MPRIPALLALALFAPTLMAQTPSHKITLDVVVTPGDKGAPVAGLQQSDFTVVDGGVQRTMTSFRAVAGEKAPVRIVLLIDAVNTRVTGVAYIRDQVGKFLTANGGHLAHPTALAVLTDKGIRLQQQFSQDGMGISESLSREETGLRTLTRDMGIYGAEDRFQVSLTALRQLASRMSTLPGRTIVIWISPGWPLISGPNIDLTSQQHESVFADVVTLSRQLREARVTLYNVDPIGAGESVERDFYYTSFLKGVSKPSQTDLGDLSLQVLATQSGGFVLNSNDTLALLQKAAADADAYYEVTFDAPPVEQSEQYRALEVKIDKPGLRARTRTGYYATP